MTPIYRILAKSIRGTRPSSAAHDSGLLTAEPAVLTEIRIGYARVSTGCQNLERQLDALTKAGCRRIFAEKKSGKNADRPELVAALEFMRLGDTLVVPSLDRLSRSLQDLITTVTDLRRRGVGFTSLHENLDTTTPGGRLVFHVFAALAEFIRELIVVGTHEGLAAARDRGRVGGRPSVVTPDIIRAARDLLPNPEHSITSIAKLLGVSRHPTTTSPTCPSSAPECVRDDRPGEHRDLWPIPQPDDRQHRGCHRRRVPGRRHRAQSRQHLDGYDGSRRASGTFILRVGL